jgi:N-acetylglucosamine-6-phosphate deacetylase
MRGKGFVDLQVNGYLGVDFSSPRLQPEDVARVTAELLSRGTLGYCATIITSPLEVYRRNLPILARAMEQPAVKGRLLGIHVEGPYISPVDGARGAHPAGCTRRPDSSEFDRMQEWANGRISIVTLAPELEGAIGFIAHIRQDPRVSVWLGHHLAPRQVIRDAVAAGATASTHLGNGCPNLIHRHDNVIQHQMAEPRLMAGLITDSHHLPEDFIRIAVACKGAGRIFVVSDSAPIAGLAPGVYDSLGGHVRMDDRGRIENVEEAHFAGSGLNMAECMRHLDSLGVLTPDQLWEVGLENPLRMIGAEPPDTSGLPDVTFR